MSRTVTEQCIALIAANGFDENHITVIQRALTKAKIPHKIVAPEQGLVNGWQNNAWGHYFTVDAPINTALGSDFDALVLIGGERSIDKLKTNPHARRIVNHFFEAGKPIAAIGAGVALLALSGKSAGCTVTAPAALHEELKIAGLDVAGDPQMIDGVVLTSVGANLDAWADAALTLFSESAQRSEQVAA
jgi:protease I